MVWQALTTRLPYCPVCDVTYVFGGDALVGDGGVSHELTGLATGTTVVCAPGRLEGDPPAGGPRGEVIENVAHQRITTRLELTTETWTTSIGFRSPEPGSTDVAIAVAHATRFRRPGQHHEDLHERTEGQGCRSPGDVAPLWPRPSPRPLATP